MASGTRGQKRKVRSASVVSEDGAERRQRQARRGPGVPEEETHIVSSPASRSPKAQLSSFLETVMGSPKQESPKVKRESSASKAAEQAGHDQPELQLNVPQFPLPDARTQGFQATWMQPSQRHPKARGKKRSDSSSVSSSSSSDEREREPEEPLSRSPPKENRPEPVPPTPEPLSASPTARAHDFLERLGGPGTYSEPIASIETADSQQAVQIKREQSELPDFEEIPAAPSPQVKQVSSEEPEPVRLQDIPFAPEEPAGVSGRGQRELSAHEEVPHASTVQVKKNSSGSSNQRRLRDIPFAPMSQRDISNDSSEHIRLEDIPLAPGELENVDSHLRPERLPTEAISYVPLSPDLSSQQRELPPVEENPYDRSRRTNLGTFGPRGLSPYELVPRAGPPQADIGRHEYRDNRELLPLFEDTPYVRAAIPQANTGGNTWREQRERPYVPDPPVDAPQPRHQPPRAATWEVSPGTRLPGDPQPGQDTQPPAGNTTQARPHAEIDLYISAESIPFIRGIIQTRAQRKELKRNIENITIEKQYWDFTWREDTQRLHLGRRGILTEQSVEQLSANEQFSHARATEKLEEIRALQRQVGSTRRKFKAEEDEFFSGLGQAIREREFTLSERQQPGPIGGQPMPERHGHLPTEPQLRTEDYRPPGAEQQYDPPGYAHGGYPQTAGQQYGPPEQTQAGHAEGAERHFGPQEPVHVEPSDRPDQVQIERGSLRRTREREYQPEPSLRRNAVSRSPGREPGLQTRDIWQEFFAAPGALSEPRSDLHLNPGSGAFEQNEHAADQDAMPGIIPSVEQAEPMPDIPPPGSDPSLPSPGSNSPFSSPSSNPDSSGMNSSDMRRLEGDFEVIHMRDDFRAQQRILDNFTKHYRDWRRHRRQLRDEGETLSCTDSEFDLRMCLDKSMVTRELIHSEAVYRMALRAQGDIMPDQRSNFDSQPEDGADEGEAEALQVLDRDRIDRWMDVVEEVAVADPDVQSQAGEEDEVDFDDEVRYEIEPRILRGNVQPDESESMRGFGQGQKDKIIRWRRECEYVRNDFEHLFGN